MSLPLAITPPVRFHVSLNVSDLKRSVKFYEVLFDRAPAKQRGDYAKFEPDTPPLVVSLEPNGQCGGGALNHLGIRLPDARQLVAVQERLEKAGIRCQREDGVECCYARQTKFWVHDPDQTLWEFYTLDEDIEHRGTGQSRDLSSASSPLDQANIWEHRLGSEIPIRIDACDDSIDEVRLRGSFNMPLTSSQQDALLSEALRVLKPGGRLFVRILAGETAHPSPLLPGPGAPVKFVPAKDDIIRLIVDASLNGIRLLKYDDPPCFICDGIKMRETHIESFKVEAI